MQEFLGQGSFGFVTIVRKKEGVMEGCLFALKSLSKQGVVEGGQVQHIKDEKSVSVLLVLAKLVNETQRWIREDSPMLGININNVWRAPTSLVPCSTGNPSLFPQRKKNN